jgi:hypothetical protein
MASDLPGPTKAELGVSLLDDKNDPDLPVPREHLVLALACLKLFGGQRALAYYCDRLVDLSSSRRR